ncbi:neurofilament medium polypeptide-like isoform X4 [Hemiscyllium ocellatum]|uniref:neurofilament medium polypeptide-like isoform X4 n=1 Tax=Hemiscyllium ocellatum TaxID=170820 RepID=UPI002966EAE9|nr:neurofilament medium polypeptide-like isoform X4 [Hemiscyllium ocellatum]
MEILLFCVVLIFCTSLVGPLEVEIFPAPLEVLANEDALLKCKYKEPESDLSHVAVRWTFTSQTAKKDVYIFNGGKHQPIRNGAKMFDNALQKGNASLYLPNVQRYEEGTYTCIVFVTPHKEEKSSVMQVSVQPKVSMSVQEIRTANGTEHFLQCDVKEFYPKPIKVSWFKLSDGKMEYVSTSQSTEDIVTNSDGTFSVSTKIKTEPTWDEQTDYRCAVEHKTIFDNFTLDADSVADKISAEYQIIGGIVGSIMCAIGLGLCVGLLIWYKKSKETEEIRTDKDSHEDRTMQVPDRRTQDQLQDEHNQEAEGGNNQEGPPEESENCPLIPVQQRVAAIEQMSKGQPIPKKNENNIGQAVTSPRRKTQEVHTGKGSHEDRTMQLTDRSTQDQLQDEHNQEAEGGIYQKETQEIRTGKDSHEDRTMQVPDRSTQDQLQDEHNQEAEGGINQEGPPSPEESENCPLIPIQQRVAAIEQMSKGQPIPKQNENNIGQAVTSPRRIETQVIRTDKDSHEDRTMQVPDRRTQDQSQDEHFATEAEGGINQEETQKIHTGKDSHEDGTMEVTDHINQDQSQGENKQEAEGGINQEETQEIHTGKDSHEDRTMQITDHLTQDQLQDEHNQEAEGGIKQEGSPSPEESENYRKSVRHRAAAFEQMSKGQPIPKKNENNIGQAVTSSRRKTEEIRTDKDSHEDRTMQVTDRRTQDQLQDEHNQEAEGGINQEEIQEIRTGKDSHEDRTMQVTDHLTQDQLQDEHNQEAEGGINQEETQEIHTGKDSHEDRTMQLTDHLTQDQLQDEHNQEAEGGIKQEGSPSPEESENYRKSVRHRAAAFEQKKSESSSARKCTFFAVSKGQPIPKKNENNIGQAVTSSRRKTEEIHTDKDSHEDRTMQVTDRRTQDQLQDEHNQEAEDGINQEEIQEIRTGKDSHEDRTMQVTDHLTQDQLQDEHNQEAEGGINQEETQEIRTDKDSHEDRTMQVTDCSTQDQLQDEHNQEADGGINPEESSSHS